MRRCLDLCLGLLLILAQPADAKPLRVSIELAGSDLPSPVQGNLKLLSQPVAGEPKVLELPFSAPLQKEIDLDPAVAWEARFEAQGVWSEKILIPSPRPSSEVRLRVFPAGSLKARVALPPGEKPIQSLAVRLQPVSRPGQQKPPEVSMVCPVEKGGLACGAPAGRYDVRLRVEASLAPVYRWDVQIPAGKVMDLGDVVFPRGASVSGWLQTTDGTPLSQECKVKLAPAGAPAEEMKIQDRLDQTALEVRPNEKGFFQITGVPPGSYEITGSQPGFAPARISPVQVRPDLEAQVIEKLVLARPVVVEVILDPPLEPYGKPWKIEIARQSASPNVALEFQKGTAGTDGIWRSPGLSPGSYELKVLGDLKAVWHREPIEVRSEQPPLHIEIPVLRVEGTVEMGGEPLSTTLWLLGEAGERLRFDSDEEGRFSGALTGEGLWAPRILSEAEGLEVSLDPIEIRKPETKRAAKVRILVPNTRIAGQVVDEAGRPVPTAQVIITPQQKKRNRYVQARTNEKGEFSVRGLSPGPILLQAVEDERQSDFLTVSVPEEGESPWQRIVLRRLQTVVGRVISPAGGVPGAMVQAWPSLGGIGAASLAQAVSGPDGHFELRLPSASGALNVVVMPPGYAMRLLNVLTLPGQTLEIPVASQGGTLVLEKGEGAAPVLVHGGIYVPLPLLETWAKLQGVQSAPGRILVPNVEAGAYSVCSGSEAISRLREGAEPPTVNCANGVLAPNGELTLKAFAAEAAGSHR